MRTFLISLTGASVLLVVVALAVPQGEVVTLHTADVNGRDLESVLWIVELPEGLHLRSGHTESGWLRRLQMHPRVELDRDSRVRAFRAVPVEDAAVRRAVNEAMAEKYGLADRLVRSTVDVDQSIPIRLEPIEAPGGSASH